MKKLYLPALLAVALMSSCGKDRTCTCTFSDSTSSETETYTTKYVEVSKSQAKAQCVSTTEVIGGVTYKEECKLD